MRVQLPPLAGKRWKYLVGDAQIKIIKTPDMKLYVEHYHPLTYIRSISHDITDLAEKDHHIALTWTPKEMILYVDGEPVAKIANEIEALAHI
ncbi:MAG: hypothetical protein QME07_06140 [bacterium]|nr:hypothetical protein [bacterium]